MREQCLVVAHFVVSILHYWLGPWPGVEFLLDFVAPEDAHALTVAAQQIWRCYRGFLPGYRQIGAVRHEAHSRFERLVTEGLITWDTALGVEHRAWAIERPDKNPEAGLFAWRRRVAFDICMAMSFPSDSALQAECQRNDDK